MLIRVTPGSIGRRVVVRHQLPSGSATDALGELESFEDGMLRVRRRDGTVAAIAESAVIASKEVPDAPSRHTH